MTRENDHSGEAPVDARLQAPADGPARGHQRGALGRQYHAVVPLPNHAMLPLLVWAVLLAVCAAPALCRQVAAHLAAAALAACAVWRRLRQLRDGAAGGGRRAIARRRARSPGVLKVLLHLLTLRCLRFRSAVIFGPDDTPWEGGTFKLSLTFTEDYPNKAPQVKFITKMFHPNIYADGAICLDILQNQWSPIYDISAILTSIQSLLTDPNPQSPANSEASKLYVENKGEYNRRVKAVVEESWKA